MEGNQLQIDINLSSNLSIGNSFTLYLKDEIDANFNVSATFVERRLGVGQVEWGNGLDSTVANLSKALKLDYGGYFDIEEIGSGVKLKAKNPDWSFVGSVTVPSELPITFIPEVVPVSEFKINSIEFLEDNINPCERIKVRVVTNQPVANYCVNQTCWQLNSNIIEFWYYRGSTFRLDLTNYIGTHISTNIQTPPLLGNISLQVLNSPNGGSVYIIHPYTNMLTYEFSLDNINWQTSNNFHGLLEGSYTAYIRDQYGCKREINFNVQPNINNIVSLNNFHFVSKSNSIRFAERVDFSSNHKTDENTLSCEMDVLKPYKQIQVFKSIDVITTQFKSNFDINEAFIIDGNNGIMMPATKKTNNIGLKDKRTAIKYNLGNGKTGIYFLTGNILDYNNNSVIGNYELNGYLPEWAKKGNVFTLDGDWFRIVDVLFDDSKNADVIIINNVYTGVDTDVIVGSEYNRENYEVYEFTVLMMDYLNKDIRIKIVLSSNDSTIEPVEYLSEEIRVSDDIENTLEIRYKNTKNTDIVYATGIEHLLRISYDLNSGQDISTSENHKTDDRVILLDADIYESNTFKFEPLTKELWRKLKIALSHDTIFIDSVGYVKEDDFETEGPLGETNLYVLTATMVKTGQIYSTKPSNDVIIIDEGDIPEIIGLIDSGTNGFIQQ